MGYPDTADIGRKIVYRYVAKDVQKLAKLCCVTTPL